MDLAEVQQLLGRLLEQVGRLLHKMPGSAILLRYIRSSYQNDPVRSAVELFLFLFFIRYLLAPTYSTQKQKQNFVALTEEEIDELVDEWTPEPLVAPLTDLEEADNAKRPVIVGATGPKSKLANGRTVTNLASYNLYNFVANESLKEKAIQTLRTYGVGPCGPPGFYGTQDVHVKTEADIASFLGTEACIVYAQAFSTIPSVIPTFSKRGDILVADRGVNYAIRRGIQISRSTVRWFDHNDMDDLERVLQRIVREQAKKPLTRRFIVTEGLFENSGDVVDLRRLVELKFRYKFRVILDETWSFGVLGKTGRGVTEQQDVNVADIDMIIGSLAGPLCAGGGFCAGSEVTVEHQRIASPAFTFSAALPAMLATTASEALILLQTNPDLLLQLRENVRAMRAQLDPRSDWIVCISMLENPVMLFTLKPEVVAGHGLSRHDQEWLLQDVVDEALLNGVLITRLKHMLPSTNGGARGDADYDPGPALKICITTGLSKKETEKAGTVVRHAVTKVLSKRKMRLSDR
ncbi:MAG: serine palmitoyltransferase component [Phylliscum demangeonii]|nr:MAG: serine palmitoyltransferase component [Phylliscum demangeonii]